MANPLSVTVGIGPVTFADVVAVARHDAHVIISGESLAEVGKTREVIESLADDHEPHYGVSTGFGAMATRYIPGELRSQLQRSLIRSHAAGSGAEVEREVVRAMMLLRISTLATGRTGVRVSTLQTYVELLNAQITPVVHEYGSLGCSGDLAPLAHCALALMGEGVVRDRSGALLSRGRRLGGGRHRAGTPGGEGGSGPDQRHRRHARHAGPGAHRSAAAAQGRRHHGGDERRRPCSAPTTSSPRTCTCSGRIRDSSRRPRTCGG